MGLHDVFRVRSPVTNRLRTVLPHKQRLRGGVKEGGQCLGYSDGVQTVSKQVGSWSSAIEDLQTETGLRLTQ